MKSEVKQGEKRKRILNPIIALAKVEYIIQRQKAGLESLFLLISSYMIWRSHGPH